MSFRNLLTFVAIGIAFTLQLGGSCASSGGNNSGDNSDSTYDSHSSDYDRPNRIPRNSDVVREGSGKLKWTSDLDGEIYVYDATRDHVDYSGPVRRNQEVVVQPDDDKVYVDKRVVSTQDIRKDSTHRIYFARPRDNRDRSNAGSTGGLPRGAKTLIEGRGEVTYRLRDAGTIYVVDNDDDRVVFSARVKRNQTVDVIPDKDRIEIDGKRAFDGNLVRDHAHRISFDKE